MPERDDFESFVDDVLASDTPKGESPKTFLAELSREEFEGRPHYAQVLLSTTPTIPGREVVIESKGLVSGRVVKGQGIWKNFKMLMGSDAFGKRSATMEGEFAAMEQECFRQLKIAAFEKGANAVVGVTIRFGETSGEADLFYAVATGTAVIIEGSGSHKR